MSVNKVILVGRLGKDPEVRHSNNGTAFCNFTLATDRSFQKDGQKTTETEWHKIVAIGRTAEVCGEYLQKGKQIYIEGRIQTREWEKDGQKRWTTEIMVERMQMLGGKNDETKSGDVPF